jgi:hypothetical protein
LRVLAEAEPHNLAIGEALVDVLGTAGRYGEAALARISHHSQYRAVLARLSLD